MSNLAIDAVKYCSKSRGPARLVLLMIADGTATTSECYRPRNGLASLASLCNCTERNLRHQMYGRKDKSGLVQGGLVQLGELVIEEMPGRPSRYFIPILQGEQGYEPTACTEQHLCNGRHTPIDRLRDDIKRDNTARRKAEQSKAYPGTLVPPPPRNKTTPRNNRSAPPEQVFRPGGNNRSAPPEQVFRTSSHMSQDLPIESHAPARAESPSPQKMERAEPEPERLTWGEMERWCDRHHVPKHAGDRVRAWNAAHPNRVWGTPNERIVEGSLADSVRAGTG